MEQTLQVSDVTFLYFTTTL